MSSLSLVKTSPPVFAFFEGEQKDIYEKALRCDGLYEMSKVYITDTGLISAIGAIKLIIKKAGSVCGDLQAAAARRAFCRTAY